MDAVCRVPHLQGSRCGGPHARGIVSGLQNVEISSAATPTRCACREGARVWHPDFAATRRSNLPGG